MESFDYRITLRETNVFKGIAICAMLFHHLFFDFGWKVYGVINLKVALACKVCVAIFVFLSGYGLATQFEKLLGKNVINKPLLTLKFLARRYLKFYLNYWIIFAITVPLGIFVFGRALSVPYGADANVLSSLLFDFWGLQGLKSYNITWWFNQLILSLYVFFPLLFVAMVKDLVGLSVLILLFVWPSEVLFPIEALCRPLSVYMFVFSLGIYFSRHGENINKVLNKVQPNILLALSFVVLGCLCYMRQNIVVRSFCGITVDPFITIFLVLFVICLCRQFNLKMKFLAFVGKHSMNMYLLHTFVGAYFFSNFIYGFKYPLIIFLVQFGINLALSVTLEFLKEKAKFYDLQTFLLGKLRF